MTIEPRIARRRQEVAEQQARARLRRSIWMLVILACAGGVAWFLVSPFMSVDEVVVRGAVHVPVEDILRRSRVVEGRPLVAIRAGTVETDLMEDPRIAAASVKLVFPTRVEVVVRERVDTAWINLGDQWGVLAADGVVLAYAPTPTTRLPQIRVVIDDPGLGARIEAPEVGGALDFIAALPDHLAERSLFEASDGELWVWVGNRIARLGLPSDMQAKATSLLTILDSAPVGLIDVTAPSRPAVRPWDSVGRTLPGLEYLKSQLEAEIYLEP
ncbi:cell division protein FtsQ/DivIB [Candidatus Spongiisocius sp.]|uniref:cell division protein FtsQ/DivIB n=1 Tax=Candidatus Spongiisocius sp. TaxID=3101273 RepID=UPI003B596CB7